MALRTTAKRVGGAESGKCNGTIDAYMSEGRFLRGPPLPPGRYGGIDHHMTAFFPRCRHQNHTRVVQLDPQVAILDVVPQTHDPPTLDPPGDRPPVEAFHRRERGFGSQRIVNRGRLIQDSGGPYITSTPNNKSHQHWNVLRRGVHRSLVRACRDRFCDGALRQG